MYETGSVVSKDLVTAYMWYNLAAARGDPKFRINRDQLEKQMTPQQVADGQKLSREWTTK
jgi:TPR repeat protein